MKAHRRIFTTGPWRTEDGDPGSPKHVLGVPVLRSLHRREEGVGALVLLEDRRYALTGATVAAGTATALRRHARRCSRRASAEERRWLKAVIAELNDCSRRPAALSLGGELVAPR